MDRHAGVSRSVRTMVACLLLPLHLASCTGWSAQSAPITTVMAAAPERVRLVPPRPAPMSLRHAAVFRDSVVGFRSSTEAWTDSTRVSVPRSTISQIDLFWRPGYHRLTMMQPASVELWHPRVVADSIVGLRNGHRGATDSLSVALAAYAHAEIRRVNAVRTTLLIVSIPVGLILALGAFCAAEGGCVD